MLPKINFPVYQTTLPWSGQEISYRPYSHGEEKILMMAATGEDESEAVKSIYQIIDTCCNVSSKDLHPLDFETCYIKLRSVSVSNILEVVMDNQCSCDHEKRPDQLEGRVDLNHVEVKGMDDLTEKGFIRKNDHWILMLQDDIGVTFNQLKEGNGMKDPLLTGLNSIFDSNSVHKVSELKPSELEDFIDGLPSSVTDKIKAFFENQPYTEAKVNARCACGKIHTRTVKGIINFFG